MCMLGIVEPFIRDVKTSCTGQPDDTTPDSTDKVRDRHFSYRGTIIAAKKAEINFKEIK